MKEKELRNFLFQLYDYADYLADKIQPGNLDNNNYFLTLVFIERFFDSIGRGEIHRAEVDSNDTTLDPQKSLSEAHRRLDLLRDRIDALSKEYDFDDALDHVSKELAIEWPRRKG